MCHRSRWVWSTYPYHSKFAFHSPGLIVYFWWWYNFWEVEAVHLNCYGRKRHPRLSAACIWTWISGFVGKSSLVRDSRPQPNTGLVLNEIRELFFFLFSYSIICLQISVSTNLDADHSGDKLWKGSKEKEKKRKERKKQSKKEITQRFEMGMGKYRRMKNEWKVKTIRK